MPMAGEKPTHPLMPPGCAKPEDSHPNLGTCITENIILHVATQYIRFHGLSIANDGSNISLMATYVTVFETMDMVEAQLYAELLSEAGLQVVEQHMRQVLSLPLMLSPRDRISLGVPENEAATAAELVSTYQAGVATGQYALPGDDTALEDAGVLQRIRHFDTALQIAVLLLLLLAFFAISRHFPFGGIFEYFSRETTSYYGIFGHF